MSGELQRYAAGNVRPARMDRAVAREAKAVYDEVRIKAFQADGALALAGHIMEGILGLDQKRRTLAQDDPVTNALLADIQSQAMYQVKKIQANLFDDWNM